MTNQTNERRLKALVVDGEKMFSDQGNPIRAIAVGLPRILTVTYEHIGEYLGEVNRQLTAHAPASADAYVTGTLISLVREGQGHGLIDLIPVQFYRIGGDGQ